LEERRARTAEAAGSKDMDLFQAWNSRSVHHPLYKNYLVSYNSILFFSAEMLQLILKGSINMQREYPDRPFAAVSIVITQNEKVLLMKRAHDPKAGLYSVPGGLVELGEKFEDSAIREVEEETGLKVELDRLIDVIDNITHDEQGARFHYVLIGFLAKPIGHEDKFILSTESLDTRWVSFDELSRYPLTNTATHFFKKLNILPQESDQ